MTTPLVGFELGRHDWSSLAVSSPDVELRRRVPESLAGLLSAQTDPEAAGRGSGDLGPECRALARDGLWLLYRDPGHRFDEQVCAILEILDGDSGRVGAVPVRVKRKQGR
ncbi:hypothetical protein [Actinosynnema pretiosum]|uniref:Uncharacterized protein n=1 Tax=Actinosynnema pretiosum TaxID=42197 RepID=A0A290Z6K0_9PSEU|nr:hypothetical protein [Actinosynnema pretiosum]ATE54605.1 hypothetical protein CNX65_15980 [Actinosynnema pretiosum]